MVSFSSYPGMMFFADGFIDFGIVLKPNALKNTKKYKISIDFLYLYAII